MNKPDTGRRGRGWEALPAGEVVTLSQAAAAMDIDRRTLLCKLGSHRHRIPETIEVIRDMGRTVGIRRNEAF